MKNKKGFTLLELLVVILIIGILAAIALPQYQRAVGKAKFATLKDNARVIKEAMDRYYLVHNEFTNNLGDLDIELSGQIRANQTNHIDLSDGSICYIGGSSIFCQRNIFNIKTEYGVVYRGFSDEKSCTVYATDLTDKSNRLCQQETGKNTPDVERDTYNSYRY